MTREEPPLACFTLTTGRSGTVALERLLHSSSELRCHHELRPLPKPLARSRARRLLYDAYSNPLKSYRRRESMLETWTRGKVHVETGWQLTFFAPLFHEQMEGRVKFIHLTRDPRTWVGSWMRLIEYVEEAGRIFNVMPREDPDAEQFFSWEIPRRSLWWWETLNRWILTLPEALDVHHLRMEDLSLERAEELFRWLGVPFDALKASRALGARWNAKPELGPRVEWNAEWERWLPRELMTRLGYP